VIHDFPAFVGIAVLVIVTPGPDTALTIRNALIGGRRGGVLTAAGVSTGQAIWTLAASAGIAALLVASRPVFEAVKLAGAAYLVYLGVQTLRGAFREHAAAPRGPGGSAYKQGVISNLANPKMAAFFTSLLPQFGDSFVALLVLGVIFSFMTLGWLSAYALVVARAGDVLRRSRVRRVLDAITGAVLVALGVRVARS
jgi:threonine/homoserine/homoserine lactone efflux protein